MKIKVYFIIVITCFSILTGYTDDYVTEKARIQGKLLELAEDYEAYSGQKANEMNFMKSIAKKNHKGLFNAEISSALQNINTRSFNLAKYENIIENCYLSNNYWLIRLGCIEAIGKINPEKSDRFAIDILIDPSEKLETKLLISNILVIRGTLFGFPILKEALASDDLLLRNIASSSLELYRKHDGKVYNNSGRKIDIKQLRKEVNSILKGKKGQTK